MADNGLTGAQRYLMPLYLVFSASKADLIGNYIDQCIELREVMIWGIENYDMYETNNPSRF